MQHVASYFRDLSTIHVPTTQPWLNVRDMGIVEKEAHKRRRRRNIQNAVLASVGVAGILTVAMVAPNIFQALPKIAGDRYKLSYRTRNAVGRLGQKGLIRFVTRNNTRCVELTERGRRALLLEEAKNWKQKKQMRRWDRRYRLVMFDIPHYRKVTRDWLRRRMMEYGFMRLQDSVWVYPHDCEELIALLKADLRIGKDVLYAVVESIENDWWIKKHFGLRS